MTAGARLRLLLGPPGSSLRRWRLLLAAALVVLAAWLLGPYQPWRLPGEPTLIPQPGQSRIHIVLVATWWAAAANAVLCGLLLLTSRFWAGDEADPLAAHAPARRRLPALSVAILLGACALAGALRWPLAQRGVWWDEAWSIRQVLVGTVKPDAEDPARLEFEPVPWSYTFWYYRKPTNHVLYSVAARTSLAVWRAATGAAPQEWDEFALRFPAFAASVLAVFLLGLLVHDLGFPRAAPAAAVLLAIHPWHIRFGADGRGYAFMVLFAIGAAWFLLRALQEARWRHWLGYAASQLALLWVHPLALHYPIALFGAGVLGIAWGKGSRADRGLRLGRFVVANVLAAIAFLQLMAPNLAQSLILSHEWAEQPDLASQLARKLWLYLATGLHVRQPRQPDVSFPTLHAIWGGGAWSWAVAYVLLPALAAIGLLRALRPPGPARFVFLGLAAAPPLVVLHRALQDFLVIERFAIYGLVAVVPLLVIGIEGVLAALLPLRLRRAGVAAGLALALLAFGVFVAPQIRVLLERPQVPSREVADYLAAAGEGIPGGVIRAGVSLGGDTPDVYDPWIVHVRRREEIAALAARSLAEGRPLYVFYGYGQPNRRGRDKEAFRDLDDPRYFEEVAHFAGIESDFVYRILRYTGRPLGGS
jgi:hypothetical protein